VPNPNDGFQMPSHYVDQVAAKLRDSGLPPPVTRIVVSTVCMVVGQLADLLEAMAPLMTPEESAGLVRDVSNAWDQLKETL